MDWDSHRSLESFFAVPMMGAILQTVNVRLSPEQIIYTIEHSGASTLLVNEDFLELLGAIRPRLSKIKTVVMMSDKDASVSSDTGIAGCYEDVLAAASYEYDFPDLDENTQATTFYTSGTTGLPKGVYYSHRQMVLQALAELAVFGMASTQGRFHSESVYMPLTPMFHVHAWGCRIRRRQLGPSRSTPDVMLPTRFGADQGRGSHIHALCPDRLAYVVGGASERGHRPLGTYDGNRRIGVAQALAIRAMKRGM
jgi:acyl-CoA synthetase (AMP-forming)/AMP-acid ligase II